MENANENAERQLERRYNIREVTHIQASWTEQERGAPGRFTVQLILDNGVEEYIIRPTADDVQPMLALFDRCDHVMFDQERKVLMFNNLKVK